MALKVCTLLSVDYYKPRCYQEILDFERHLEQREKKTNKIQKENKSLEKLFNLCL